MTRYHPRKEGDRGEGIGSAENYFYHSDALGSITYLTDEQGNIVESYEYSAYGVPTIRDKNGRIIDSSLTGNPFMFTGREYDSETGLYFYRARYYDPAVGRFISEDPIGFQGGDLNLYAYVRNNPVNTKDPMGLEFITQEEGALIADEASTWVGTLYVSPGNKKGIGADCSGSTNQIYINAGFPYINKSSWGISKTAELRLVPGNIPQIGDIAWWLGHVAIYDPRLEEEGFNIWTARQEGKNYGKGDTEWWREKGNPVWYRYYKPDEPKKSLMDKIIDKIKEIIR